MRRFDEQHTEKLGQVYHSQLVEEPTEFKANTIANRINTRTGDYLDQPVLSDAEKKEIIDSMNLSLDNSKLEEALFNRVAYLTAFVEATTVGKNLSEADKQLVADVRKLGQFKPAEARVGEKRQTVLWNVAMNAGSATQKENDDAVALMVSASRETTLSTSHVGGGVN